MTDEEKRHIVFKVIAYYLASNLDKTVNVYYRFNEGLFLPLKFSGIKPMLVLNGQLVSFHYAATEYFGPKVASYDTRQNAHINLSFLLTEIADIDEFKNLKFKVKHKVFTDKINYLAREYIRLTENKPQPLTLENITAEVVEKFQPDDEELTFIEGKVKYALHTRKERNKKVVALKKKLAFDLNPLLPCEICTVSFKEKYGSVGEGFIEAHHIFPISDLTEKTETKVDDLILVCPNCHKMIHRKRPWLTVEQIKRLLAPEN